jgi:hypothetical protein
MVGSPSANADSTGVTGMDSRVGDGSCEGNEVAEGTGATAPQAFRTNIREKDKQKTKESFFIAHLRAKVLH